MVIAALFGDKSIVDKQIELLKYLGYNKIEVNNNDISTLHDIESESNVNPRYAVNCTNEQYKYLKNTYGNSVIGISLWKEKNKFTSDFKLKSIEDCNKKLSGDIFREMISILIGSEKAYDKV